MDFHQKHLVNARAWRRAVFTTYALSLSFFESVVLDRLVRGRTAETLILADAEGVRAGLTEQGAQRTGRDYELEPVILDQGVFHPKISAFIDHDDAHLVVGSGNLTFSGWGGNFELAEHLHPSFAADAFDDAALFFMTLAGSDIATHGAAERCEAVADDLALAASRNRLTGDVRLLHSLDGSIGNNVAGFADELGGATRLTAVSPFWDSGKAVSTLCKRLGLSEFHVHAHPGGSVRSRQGTNWPTSPDVPAIPVAVADLAEGGDRLLHAKAFEIVCRRGRILMSGSANATWPALYSGNVEASVVRIQRERLLGWTLVSSAVPVPLPPMDTKGTDDGEHVGLLRAEVAGETVKGTVLSPKMSGPARLLQRSSEGDAHIAEIEVAPDGSFTAAVPGFELGAIRGGRVVFRIECGGQAAEGFASLSTLAGLRRIAGKSAASLLAVLSGTETPEDVRVLMEWAHDNPGMLVPAFSGGGWGTGQQAEIRPFAIPMSDLRNVADDAPRHAGGGEAGGNGGWTRFVDALLSAMRERRGAAAQREDNEDQEGRDNPRDADKEAKEAAKSQQAAFKALEIFDLVFEAMLPSGAPNEAALRAFDIAGYVCDRLPAEIAPDKARVWLRRVIDAICANGTVGARKETALAAIIALCGSDPDRETLRATRGRIMTVGGDLSGACPAMDEAASFMAAMGDEGKVDECWRKAGEMRIWREQARFYCDALEGKGPDTGFDELLAALPDEGRTLSEALATGNANGRVLAVGELKASCPCCNRALPSMEKGKLKSYGVAKAANCCQRVLVWPQKESTDVEAIAYA